MKACAVALLLVALGLATGCSSRPAAAPPSDPFIPFASLAANSALYLGHRVAVEGLPVYPTAVEVSPGGRAAEDGTGADATYYVLINRRDPLSGLLVRAHTSLSLDRLRAQPGSSLRVVGRMAEFPGGDIQEFIRRHHGVHLLTGPHGGALWIEDEGPGARVD